MSWKRNCSAISCGSSSVISLDQQDFCLNHFLDHCYQRLDAVDPRSRKAYSSLMSVASLRAFIEECSRKALDLSLHTENLTNLQRGRLLDILLWAGELFVLLRAPRFLFLNSLASAGTEARTFAIPATAENLESSAVLGKSNC